jgi:NAD(P)-dependent dehydrogenase (short-subunit alcohol dehydrogenase family)
VVTGATSGLGRWIARGLAEAGFTLTLIVRSEARGEAARRWIRQAVPSATIDLAIADLSSLAETRAAAARIRAEHPRIALLVNNAAVLVPRRAMTAEGHEVTCATNLLSPLALTEALRPALAAASPSRVVMIGSSTSDHATIDPDDLGLARGWRMSRAYARSKLALLMMSRIWAERLAPAGITLNVVHPGVVRTDLLRHGGVEGLAWRIIGAFALSPAQGAEAPLHACLSPALEGRTGLYLKRRGEAAPNPRVEDKALVARLEAAVSRLLA